MTASEILKTACPAHRFFIKWLEGKEPTKRQARKFLRTFPNFVGEK